MKLHQALLSGAAALLAILTSNPAKAAPFANGSFEQPGVASGTEQALPDGSTAIAGWTVGASGATYDAGTGFSAAQNDSNTRPWQYGYRDTLPSSSFTLLPQATALGETDFWSVGGSIPSLGHNRSSSPASAGFDWTLQPNQLLLHPSSGSAYYCVLRWTAPADGTYAIHAAWSGLGGNSTVDVHVLVDGDPKDNRTLSGQGATTTYDSTVPFLLVAGKTIEFVVGSGDGNATGDSTGLYATITAQSASGPGMVYVKDDLSHPAQAVNGAHLVSFGRSGGSGGTLSQTFDTVPGTTYTVNYRLTTEGTTDDGQTMSVAAFDGATSLAVANSNIPFTQGQWSFGTPLTFTATSTSTRLVFTDTTPTLSGATGSWALDDVTLSVTVPGSANVWLAGAAPGTTARNTDDTTTAAPVEAPIAVTPGQDVTFGVSGGVIHNSSTWPGSPGPDGDAAITHLTENAIAGLKAPVDALVGVFLGAAAPSGTPQPLADFSVADNRDYDLLQPGLLQPFFIGDGRTQANTVQRVRIPAGATRLFLGALDEYDNAGNGGSFSVLATVVAALPDLTDFTNSLVVTPATAFGEDWTFTITQNPSNAARTVRVQTTLTPNDPFSWVDLPGGGEMTLGANGEWSLATADVPLGSGRQFRVVVEGAGYSPTVFTEATPNSYEVAHPAGRILYTRGSFGSMELVLMQPDGSEKTLLTNNSLGVTFSPVTCTLSPDGRKAAFTTFDGKLWVMKAEPIHSSTNEPVDVLDGADTPVTFNSVPAWSPDGHYLAYASSDTRLYVIEAVDEGGDIAPFDEVQNAVIEVGQTFASTVVLAWSPDGTYLANTEGSNIQAFRIMDDQGNITPSSTTNSPVTLTQIGETTQKVSLAWAPDGQQIAFSEQSFASGTHWRVALLTVRDTNGELTPESGTNARVPINDFNEFVTEPQTVSWSPDGSLLAVQELDNNTSETIVTIYKPEPIDATNNPGVVLTTLAEGNTFQPMFKQPVGGFPAPQSFTFEAATYSGNEEGGPIVVKVKRSGSSAGEVTIDFTVTADPYVDPVDDIDQGASPIMETADFTITSGPLVFAEGETEKTITITPIDDAIAEGDGNIVIELFEPDAGELGAITTTTVTLADGESSQLPFVAPAADLRVFINGKQRTKGKGTTDALWRFEARQPVDNTQTDLALLIQYSTTPENPASWKFIPKSLMDRGGPQSTAQTWKLETDDLVPGANTFFRTYTVAGTRRPTPGPVLGPFLITGNGLKFSVSVKPTADPTPTFDKKNVPSYTTVAGDLLIYTLVSSNRGEPVTDYEVNCRVPDGTHIRVLNNDPNNPIYDIPAGAAPVFTGDQITAIRFPGLAMATGGVDIKVVRLEVDDDIRAGQVISGKANLLTNTPQKLLLKRTLPKVTAVVPFLLETTVKSFTSFDTENETCPRAIVAYTIGYKNLTSIPQTGALLHCLAPNDVTVAFADNNHDGIDDTNGYRRDGTDLVWDLGAVAVNGSGEKVFVVQVDSDLKLNTGQVKGPKCTLKTTNLRKPVAATFPTLTVRNPLSITVERLGRGLVRPGQEVHFLIRCTNRGPTLADVVASVRVPDGTTFRVGEFIDTNGNTLTPPVADPLGGSNPHLFKSTRFTTGPNGPQALSTASTLWFLGDLQTQETKLLKMTTIARYDLLANSTLYFGDPDGIKPDGSIAKPAELAATRAGYSLTGFDPNFPHSPIVGIPTFFATGDVVGVRLDNYTMDVIRDIAPTLGLEQKVIGANTIHHWGLGRDVEAVIGKGTVRCAFHFHNGNESDPEPGEPTPPVRQTAEGVTIEGDLPENTTLVPGSFSVLYNGQPFALPQSRFKVVGRHVTFGWGSLADGESVDLIFDVDINDNFRGDLIALDAWNLYSDSILARTLGTPSPNYAFILPPVALSIEKDSTVCDHDQVAEGEFFTYIINFKNTGGLTATDVFVDDQLPIGTTLPSEAELVNHPERRARFLDLDDNARAPEFLDGVSGTKESIELRLTKHSGLPMADGALAQSDRAKVDFGKQPTVRFHVKNLARYLPGVDQPSQEANSRGRVALTLKLSSPLNKIYADRSNKIENQPTIDVNTALIPREGRRSRLSVRAESDLLKGVVDNGFDEARQETPVTASEDPHLFLGKMVPASVLEEKAFVFTLFFGNCGGLTAENVKVAVLIPPNTTLVPNSIGRPMIFVNGARTATPFGVAPKPKGNKITWEISGLTAHSGGAVQFAIYANKDFALNASSINDSSAVIVASNANTAIAPASATRVRSTDWRAGIYTSIGTWFKGLGADLGLVLGRSPSFDSLMNNLPDNASFIVTGATDQLQFKDPSRERRNGTIILPLGQGNVLAVGREDLIVRPNGARLVGQDGASVVASDGAGLVGQDGASLVGQDGASIVAAGGGNAIGIKNVAGLTGISLATTLLDTADDLVINKKAANIVAGGGGNLIEKVFDPSTGAASTQLRDSIGTNKTPVGTGGTGIVAAGGGNIVAAGGGNIVAGGGGNIVAGGGGNIVAAGGGNVLSHNGNAIVAGGGMN